MIKLAVLGTSAIAASLCAMACLQGHYVRQINPPGRQLPQTLSCTLPDGTVFQAVLHDTPADIQTALEGIDLVFICVPHHGIEAALSGIAKHLPSSALICGVPGFGGFGIQARTYLPGQVIFGLQRIPFVIRSFTPNGTLHIGGIRRQTFVGAMPAANARRLAQLITAALGIPAVPVSHYVNIELSQSNTFMNSVRLYALFCGLAAKDYPPAETEVFADWDSRSSDLFLDMDKELRSVCAKIPRDTSFVAPVLFQYEACDSAMLTDQIRSLTALHGRRIPRSGKGPLAEPDTGSTYVTDDIGIGLRNFRDIARLAGCGSPLADRIWDWAHSLKGSGSGAPFHAHAGPVADFQDIEALMRHLD